MKQKPGTRTSKSIRYTKRPTGRCGHFNPQILKDPEKALCTIEQELDSQEIYRGNDWLGRGVVGDSIINATIEGLEIVRSDCLAILKATNSKKQGI